MIKKFKRYLYLIHRWLGVVLCALFGLWFASGFVMMYVGYPELTRREHYESLPELAVDQIAITPSQAVAAFDIDGAIDRFALTTVLQRPAYRIVDGRNVPHTIFADTGEILAGLSPAIALRAARSFIPNGKPTYDAMIAMDQWTVSSSLNRLRPLHRVRLNDGRGTVVYVSDVSGQVVRDTNNLERGWNWLGTTIHWVYPVQLRRHVTLWENVVIYLSLAGVFAALTGSIIGVLRLRVKQRYKGGRVTPYTGVQRLHHIFGLIIGGFVLMFIFSGLMSMNPWGVFNSGSSAQSQIERYRGGGLDPTIINAVTSSAPSSPAAAMTIKEIEWRNIGDQSYWLFTESSHRRQAVFPHNEPAGSQAFDTERGVENLLTLRDTIDAAAPALIPDAQITATNVLSEYDHYYYSHHDSYRPLPVLRVRFDDPESTWFHIDLSTGEVLNRLTSSGRAQRWLYNGMHSLDFIFLIENRPLWDIVVFILSAIGLFFSGTSVIIGWRRITR